MDYKNNIVVFVFFVVIMVCVHCLVDSVNAPIVPSQNLINREPYLKVHSNETAISTTIRQRSSRRRRFRKECRLIEQADLCAGPTRQMNKTEEGPCQQLVVWVPKNDGFTEFAKTENFKVEGGFSIAIFCCALQLLPFRVQPMFKPYINDKGESNGTYDQLLHHIEGTAYESVAGDVTVRSSRTQYVDFTTPYLSSEVYMRSHGSHEWNQTLWTFLRPLTRQLWFAIVGTCIFIGVAVAILEYRADNPRYKCIDAGHRSQALNRRPRKRNPRRVFSHVLIASQGTTFYRRYQSPSRRYWKSSSHPH